MDKRDFENKLKEESSKINIEMSENLKNTPIVQSANIKNQSKKLSLFPKLASICCVLILMVCCGLFCFNKGNTEDLANLTSYIMEINPSICITTDINNKIVNVCALNEDADTILSNSDLDNIIGEDFEICINKIIKVISDEGYFENYENTIKLYAINDNKEIRNKKINDLEVIVQRNLNDLGFGHIPFEKHEMEMKDFKEKMGFDEDFGKLDDMHDFLKNKDKHHNPLKELPPDDHDLKGDPQEPTRDQAPIDEPPHDELHINDNPPHDNNTNNKYPRLKTGFFMCG